MSIVELLRSAKPLTDDARELAAERIEVLEILYDTVFRHNADLMQRLAKLVRAK